MASGPILSDGNSIMTNYGTYNATNMQLYVPLMNFNVFVVYGQNSPSVLTTGFVAGSNSRFYLLNSILIVQDGNFTISGGFFDGTGIIQTSHFIFDSQDGYLQLSAPHTLTIIGNATFTSRSTVILTLNGVNAGQIDTFNVTGSFVINSLTLLKLGNDYTPKVDDRIQFLACGGLCQSEIRQVFLLGAPYKNAKYSFESDFRKPGYLEIIFSFGSVDTPGYQCTYLGDRRILEMNPIQSKWMFSLTIPLRSDVSIGFGFDFNGTIDSSLLILRNPENHIQQYGHNSSAMQIQRYLVAAATISQSIFGSWSKPAIGPNYTTINIIFPGDYLINQRFIYYAELAPNGTNVTSHFHQRYDFSVLNSPVIPCTNFLQPTRVEVYRLAVTISLLIVYVILFVLCIIILSRFRPLNTRGVSPHLTLFFLFTQLILETRNYAVISDVQSSLCLYYTFAMYPLQQIVFVMILLYFLSTLGQSSI